MTFLQRFNPFAHCTSDHRQREQVEASAARVMDRVTEKRDELVQGNTERLDIYTRLVDDLRRKEGMTA